MNELEDLLRQQLHKAADPIVVKVDERAALEAGRRARTLRTVRWIVLAIALLAAVTTALVAVSASGLLDRDQRAVPNPLQTPTVETTAPTPDASPSPDASPEPDPTPTTEATVPATDPPAGEAALIDLGFRDGTGKVRVQFTSDGVRFTGVDAGDTGSVVVPGPRGGVIATHADVPGPGWVVAVLPGNVEWASFVDGDYSQVGRMGQVPGTDLIAVAAKVGNPESTPRLVWGSQGRILTSDGRTLPSASFTNVWGDESTYFIDDTWRISGYTTIGEGPSAQFSTLDTSLLAVTSMGGPDADTIEFVLSLPAGADPASVTWDLGVDYTVEVARQAKTLPDGRILVHEGFRAPGITNGWGAQAPTATYTNAAGQRVTAPIWKP